MRLPMERLCIWESKGLYVVRFLCLPLSSTLYSTFDMLLAYYPLVFVAWKSLLPSP